MSYTLFPRENVSQSFKQHAGDFQTPVPVGKLMASMVPPGAKTVLEPTPGIGRLVSVLGKYQVTAPEDFFLLPKQKFDCVVMNPPFSSKYTNLQNAPDHLHETGMRVGYAILLECMSMSDDIIALMPWFTLSDSDIRLRRLKKYGMISITALPRKTFQYARVQTCVLQLKKGWKEETLFKVFNF